MYMNMYGVGKKYLLIYYTAILADRIQCHQPCLNIVQGRIGEPPEHVILPKSLKVCGRYGKGEEVGVGGEGGRKRGVYQRALA